MLRAWGRVGAEAQKGVVCVLSECVVYGCVCMSERVEQHDEQQAHRKEPTRRWRRHGVSVARM